MKASIVDKAQYAIFNGLYKGINKYPKAGRFAALPVAVLEISMFIGSVPLRMIENLALVPINAVGRCFNNKKFSLKDMGSSLRKGVIAIPVGVLALSTSPAFVALQTLNILISPHRATSLIGEIDTFVTNPGHWYSKNLQCNDI
ncbi:MAG: hypothetical protein ACSNEK_09680 [Parachlamydiaceae bacterium]